MPRRRFKDGVALVLVLWAVILLSALAMAASASFRGFAAVIATSQDEAKADALLDAGLEAAAMTIGSLGDQPVTEREFEIKLKTGAVHLRLRDEAGCIDLNKAPVKLLASLLRSVGADDADALAKAIDAVRTHGEAAPPQPAATASSPGAAGTPGAIGASSGQPAANDGGSNKPPVFTDVAQLSRIAGITPDIVAAIAPLVTVFGGEKVSAATAPEDVVAALPNIHRAQIDAFLSARQRGPLDEGQAKSLLGPASDFVDAQKKRSAASVDLETRLPDGYSEAAHATIIVLPRDTLAYRVLQWSPFPVERARGALAEGEL